MTVTEFPEPIIWVFSCRPPILYHVHSFEKYWVPLRGFPGGSVVRSPPAKSGDTRDTGLIPVSARSLGRGNGNSLQYSCLENPMDRGTWQATVHESDMTEQLHTLGILEQVGFTKAQNNHRVVVVVESLSRVWLCHDPTDYSPWGSSVHRFSQARMLEWVTISFPRGSSWPSDQTCVSCIGRWILNHWATRKVLSCFLDSTHMWNYTVFVFLWLISLSIILSRSIHGVTNARFLFLWLNNIL